MGWPRKDANERLYFEKKSKTYLLVHHDMIGGSGNYDAVGELLIDNDPENPKLCGTGVSPSYLASWDVRRASWSEMPQAWKDALARYLPGPPEECRGLWRMDEHEKNDGSSERKARG